MTCPDCDREMHRDRCPCGYVRPAITLHVTKPKELPGIDKDQFGRPLFDTIFCIGEILQLQDMQRKQDRNCEDYQRKETSKHSELAAMVSKLSVSDQEALIMRYPRLFT